MLEQFALVGATGWGTLTLGVVAVAAGVLHALLARRATFGAALTFLALALAAAVLGTLLGLRSSYAGVALAEPSMKASMLARGISEAMNCAVYGAGTLFLWVAPFVIGEVRRRR
jgi:hypothetical protein